MPAIVVVAAICLAAFPALRARRPTSDGVRHYLDAQLDVGLNGERSPKLVEQYIQQGRTPRRYVGRAHVVTAPRGGRSVYARTCELLESGSLLTGIAWASIAFRGGRPQLNGTLATVVNCYGCAWSLNPCRVIALERAPMRTTLAYGTLRGHLLRGQEAFDVSIDRAGRVTVRVASVAQPSGLLGALAMPLIAPLRQRFLRDAAVSLAHAGSSVVQGDD